MSLIRCRNCKLDTSDTLERCPNCGIALGSAPARSPSESQRSVESIGALSSTRATPAAGNWIAQIGGVPRAFLLIGVLIVLATVPHTFPVLIVLAIVWQALTRARSGERARQAEVWQVFQRDLKGAQKNPAEKPLERLRRIERDLKIDREA